MREFPLDIWLFLRLVFTTWEGYVSAGVVALAVALWERFKDRPISKTAFLWGLVAFLLVSFFSVWRAEKLRARDANEKLDRLTKPNFEIGTGNILTLSYNITESINPAIPAGDHTLVVIPTFIYNHGAPSIVRHYALTAVLKDGTKIAGEQVVLRETHLKLRDPKGDGFIVYPVQPSLVQRASQQPIVTGGVADGVLTFVFPIEMRAKIPELGSFLIVEVTDINQRTYNAKIPMKPANQIEVTPGMLPT